MFINFINIGKLACVLYSFNEVKFVLKDKLYGICIENKLYCLNLDHLRDDETRGEYYLLYIYWYVPGSECALKMKKKKKKFLVSQGLDERFFTVFDNFWPFLMT